MTATLILATLVAAIIITVFGVPFALVRQEELAPRPRRVTLAGIMLLLTVAVVTVAAMEISLRRVARRAGQPIHGLIGAPVPNTSDHEYTAHGKEYEAVVFRRPFMIGSLAVVAIAFVFPIAAGQSRGTVLWLLLSSAAGVVGVIFLFWVAREFSAWDIFI